MDRLGWIFLDEFTAALAGWVAVLLIAGLCVIGFNLIKGKRP